MKLVNKNMKYKALKRHICRFNDGECECKCFDKGYRAAIKHILAYEKEWRCDDGNIKSLLNK